VNPDEITRLGLTALSYGVVPFCFLIIATGVEFSTNNSSCNEFPVLENQVM
jgi:hypothetical protein